MVGIEVEERVLHLRPSDKIFEMKEGRFYVNEGKDDQMEVQGFYVQPIKRVLTWLGYLLTLGLLRLLFYWLPHLNLYCSHTQTSKLYYAQKVLLKDAYRQKFVCTVRTMTREGTGVKVSRPKLKKSKGDSVFIEPEADESLLKYFVCKKVKYIWDTDLRKFMPLHGLDEGCPLSSFHNAPPLSAKEQAKRRILFGTNSIPVHVTPILKLLFKEALSPFYIFQAFSVSVWYADQYEVYASCIIAVSSLSIAVTIYQIRKFERALRNTTTSSSVSSVCRDNGEFEDIPSELLVPGDVIEIPRHGCSMQCDAALLTGNCIVNESMLTGESVPVTKTPLPNPTGMTNSPDPDLDMTTHSRHILFSGTQVIQTRFYGNQKVKAVVLRTGFNTSKGELVRSIMFPKPVDFKFYRHSYYFLLVLAAVACLGFIYTIVLMVNAGDDPSDIVKRSLDLITIAVPPALPAALAVGIVFSQNRLKANQVYCISPRGINLCGTITTVCFDKTGTLTEDGLDMHGVVSVDKTNRFSPLTRDAQQLPLGPLVQAMATCHSLTIIDGKLTGDPLDLIMFNATDWVLEEPGPEESSRFDMMTPTVVRPRTQVDNGLRQGAEGDALAGSDVGIVRQFPFSSSLQRMSVITRSLGSKNFDLYVKGSPEMITSLSKQTTVPSDFHQTLQSYTQHGYRVIALAWKPLPSKLNYVKAQRIGREQLENKLTFLGLLVMENRLKPQTSPVMTQLMDAEIKTVMVTGDNMLTALSVAKECGMVDRTDRIILVQAYPPRVDEVDVTLEFVYADDKRSKVEEVYKMGSQEIEIDEDSRRFHFALTGKTWSVIRQYCPELMSKLVVRGVVFARMSPDQKAQLVEVLQDIGHYVGMCGDGANDCGALKTAHMGISLSEAEASVASPFTSKNPTIECVPHVIKEGRAALVTSFGVFKYIAGYSLTQFTSVLLLYWVGANLTDYEFLYIDLFLITSFIFTFSRTGPYKDLVRERPLISLLSFSPIMGIISQTAIVVVAQTLVMLHIQSQPWYIPFKENDDDDYRCHENTAIFLISVYQYIILAMTFSKGAPFRARFYTNFWLMINVVVAIGISVWFTMYPTDVIADILELEPFPSYKYRGFIIGVAFLNFAVSYFVEKMLVDNDTIRQKVLNKLKGRLRSEPKYHIIESEIDNDPNWPPVSEAKVDLAEMFQRLDSVHHIPPIVANGKAVSSSLPPTGGDLEDLLESDLDDKSEVSHGSQLLPAEPSTQPSNSSSSLHNATESQGSNPTSSASDLYDIEVKILNETRTPPSQRPQFEEVNTSL